MQQAPNNPSQVSSCHSGVSSHVPLFREQILRSLVSAVLEVASQVLREMWHFPAVLTISLADLNNCPMVCDWFFVFFKCFMNLRKSEMESDFMRICGYERPFITFNRLSQSISRIIINSIRAAIGASRERTFRFPHNTFLLLARAAHHTA